MLLLDYQNVLLEAILKERFSGYDMHSTVALQNAPRSR